VKKKHLLILLLILVVGSGYFLLVKVYSNKGSNPWNFIPETAAWVYEGPQVVSSTNKVFQTNLWKALENIPFYEELRSSVGLLDSLTGNDGSLDRIFRGNSLLVSAHVVKNDDFDFLFCFSLSGISEDKKVLDVVDSFLSSGRYKLSSRNYQGVTIYEVKAIDNPLTIFSYIIHSGVFAGSFTPFLVEDAIRSNANADKGFRMKNQSLFPLPNLANDDGNLYLNFRVLGGFLASFVDTQYKDEVRALANFAENGFLDFTVAEESILLNGFSLISAQQSNYLSTIDKQTSKNSPLFQFLPTNTGLLFLTTVENPLKWHKANFSYLEKMNSEWVGKGDKLVSDYDFSFERFFQSLGSEWMLAWLENQTDVSPHKLLFVKTRDLNDLLNQLNQLSEKSTLAKGDSLFIDIYADTEIRELGIEEFPSLIFGPLYSGFEQVYYAVMGNYVVFGSSIVSLKNLLADIEAENTWAKSVSYNRFLEGTLKESNFSMMFHTQKIWNILIPMLDNKWREFALNHATVLQGFDMGAVQFTDLNEHVYTSVTIRHDEKSTPKTSYQSFKKESITEFSKPIVTRPILVKNHISNQLEVLIQEENNVISLVSKDGVVLWQDSIKGGQIKGKVQQIDYFKNGKLQYLFTTSNSLYIVDRLGRTVDGFPLSYPEGVVAENVSVIDYDNSKQYRFMVVDKSGAIFMYSKERENLEGWRPLQTGGKLAVDPFHIRVKGRDFLIALLEKGQLVAYTRRGEVVPGFPVDLGARTPNNLFVEVGSDFTKTLLTTINTEGIMVKINLEGKIVERIQLYKPSKDTRFQLVKEVSGNQFIIARQDLTRMSILDNKGNDILEKDYLTSNQLSVQYYEFGSGKKLFAITDKVQEFTYIYDETGKLVNYRPLESSDEVGVLYQEAIKKFHIYHVIGNELIVSSF
jgi:hypothetical protein